MNEIVTIPATEDRSASTRASIVAGAKPRAIVPTDLEQVYRFAQMVTQSGLAPEGMREPQQVAVAICHGLEIGLTPMTAIQRIAVINGRPAIWGDAAIALVRASGLCEYVEELIEGDGEAASALCRAKRKGEQKAVERRFSVNDAKTAGLWGRNTWKQYPKRMLQMRARGFALRDLFADVLGGLYLAEELEDAPPMRDVTPPKKPPAPSDEVPAVAAQRESAPPAASAQEARKPPAPSAEADDDIPGFLRRTKPPSEDPEAFLKWADERLGAATADTIETVWNDEIGPRIDQLLPPDQEEAAALLRKHERRVAP